MTKQERRVFQYIENHGSINAMEAWRECGVYRLSAVIYVLRHEHGYPISMRRVPVRNSFDEICLVGQYSFERIDSKPEPKNMFSKLVSRVVKVSNR